MLDPAARPATPTNVPDTDPDAERLRRNFAIEPGQLVLASMPGRPLLVYPDDASGADRQPRDGMLLAGVGIALVVAALAVRVVLSC